MRSGFRERLGIDDMITVVQQVAAAYHEYWLIATVIGFHRNVISCELMRWGVRHGVGQRQRLSPAHVKWKCSWSDLDQDQGSLYASAHRMDGAGGFTGCLSVCGVDLWTTHSVHLCVHTLYMCVSGQRHSLISLLSTSCLVDVNFTVCKVARRRPQISIVLAVSVTVVCALCSVGTDVDEEHYVSKYRVTMVSWSTDDEFVITAVNDFSLKVWDSHTGRLLHILQVSGGWWCQDTWWLFYLDRYIWWQSLALTLAGFEDIYACYSALFVFLLSLILSVSAIEIFFAYLLFKSLVWFWFENHTLSLTTTKVTKYDILG